MTAFSKTNPKGRSTGKMKLPKWAKEIETPFVQMSASMLNSPAWRELSRGARQVLDRLIVENCDHAGVENGRLICPHKDFKKYGIDGHAISPAIRELEALGFIRVKSGGAGNGDFHQPNIYSLTFIWTEDGAATNDWKSINSESEARAKARSARDAKAPAKAIDRRRRAAS